MQHFHNILFVSNGIADETEALKQSLSLAQNNKARLKALIVSPELPIKMADYKDSYEAFLKSQLLNSIQAVRGEVNVSDADVPIEIEVASGDMPANRIIHHVLRHAHDLIIKDAEVKEDSKGFKAIDMELLRKSPCPVWLCRPIKHHQNDISVAVAIDPENMVSESSDLSLRLLELSRSLADKFSGELHVISCWDFALEDSLHFAPWIDVDDDALQRNVKEARTIHHKALENLLSQSGISGKIQVCHVRGSPDQMVPKTIEDKKIDILVMGTVARTGIPGFIIGNTAENVLQRIGCSLIALKPNGFISPVEVY
jgi:universal stress protein E